MATVLSPGDIAIIHYTSDDPDSFAFVFLRDVEAGTTVNFTDNGWQTAGGFLAGEGTATYTAPTDIVAGTVVSAPLGTMGLSFLGDQIIAYQGTEASPTFLYAIDFADGNSAFAADATGVLTTALPPSLALGVTAIALPFDNAVYTGPTSGFASQLDVLEAIGNTANWTGSDAAPSLLPPPPPVFDPPDRPSIDLDFDNSTHGGRDYRANYNQGGTTVGIADTDIEILDNADDALGGAQIRVRNPQPDYLLSLDTSLLPGDITATAYDPVTGILSLNGEGSPADYETAIGLLRFSSTSAVLGDQIRVNVSIFDLTKTQTEATAFIRITGNLGVPVVAPFLDLDTNNSNGGSTDYTATFTEGGPAIPIADVDVSIADDGTLLQSARVFLGINRDAADELLFTGGPGPITTTGYDPATGVLTLTGEATLDAYEAALRQVVYRSNSATPPTGDRVIEVTVNDGTVDSNVARTYMHVIDVAAAAPALDLDANNSTTTGANYLTGYTQGAPAVAIADTDVDISDADSDDIVSATITLTNPQVGDVLSLGSGFPAGISASLYDPATGILTLNGPAPLATFETALQNIVFSNVTSLSTATRTIAIVVSDGVTTSNTATAYVQVEAAVPAAPVLDLDPNDSGGSFRTTFRTTFTENGAPVAIADTDTSIIDTDSPQLASATITLMNHQAGDLLTAAALLPGGIVASPYDPATGILTLDGPATPDEYEAALQQIFYSNGGDDPVTLDRLIEVVVNDGVNDSNVAAALIGVAAVNDAPVFTIDETATYLENDPALPLSPLAGLTDADDTDLTSATVTITAGSFPGDGDVLTVNGDTSGVVEGVTFEWHPDLHALALSGANSLAVYQELLRNIEFQSSSDNPTDYNANPTRTLSWTISDGTAVTTATSTLNIVAPNDPPEVTVAAAVTYTENAAPVIVSSAATVTDADSFSLTDGLVEIVSGGFTGDILTVNGLQSGTFAGIDFSFVTGTGLIFNGAAQAADYEAFLQAVGYHSTSENPTNSGLNPTRTLSWTVFDGRAPSAIHETTISITPLNDAPVAVDDGPVTTAEDTPLANINVLGNDTDVDLDTLTISGTPTALHGSVTVNPDGTLNYTPNADYNGADTITYLVTDGSLTDTGEVAVTVSAVNDGPVAVDDGPVTTAEDTLLSGINVLGNDTDVDLDVLTISGTPTALHGTVTVNPDGTLNYTPAADFNGADTITYVVTDGSLTDTGEVAVTVTAVNDGPVAVDDGPVTTAEDTPLANINVLGNDTDVDLDVLAISGTPTALHGTVTVNPDGTLNYTPAADFNGADTISYVVTDGSLTDTGEVAVTVTAVNDGPVAVDDGPVTTAEDTPLANINVLGNDTDVDLDVLAISGTPTALHGTVTVNPDGTLNYTPAADFNGADTITYVVTDGSLTDTGEVAVTVTAVNDGPVAVDDGPVTTAEDTPLANINVLGNDTDVDLDVLAISGTPTALHGTVTVNPDGTLNYTPAADFNGADTITYVVTDGSLTDTGEVAVTVTAVNDGPVAVDDGPVTTAEDTPLANINVLGNDTDVDLDVLAISGTPTALHGTVTVNPDGTLNYTPAADFNGADTITYVVTDGSLTDTGEVAVTVTAVNDGPVAVDDGPVTTAEDTPLANINVLGNDTDVDLDTLTISGTPTALHGTVTVNPDGTLNYTPAADYNGADTITYLVTDGSLTDTGEVAVTVTAVNDGPVAVDDGPVTTAEDTLLSNINVLGNDTDVDLDTLTISGTPTALHGTVTVNPDGTLNYTPAADYNGADTITYLVTDGLLTDTGEVAVTVTAVNDGPVAVDDGPVTTAEDTLLSNINVLGNDTDVDLDTLTISGTPTALHGTVTVNPDGTLNYTPTADYNGADTITYVVTDGSLTDTGEVAVTVSAVNDGPVAVDDGPVTTAEDTPLANINVLGNDTDVDLDTLTISGTPTALHGTVTVNPDGTLNYTPTADYNGADTITYVVTDGSLTDTGEVAVTVTAVNDGPVAVDDGPVTTAEDTPLANIDVLGNDTDVDLDTLTISGTPTALHGTVTVNPDGTLNYTPTADYNGADTITYLVTDGSLTDTGEVAVTVSGVNNAPVAVDDGPVTTAEDTPLSNIDVLGNDTDVDLDTLTISGTPTALHGTVTVNPDGTLNYTPNADYNGPDTISYLVTDGSLTDTGEVAVTVTAVNDAPVAQVGTASGNEDTVISGAAVATDVDHAANLLTYALVGADGGAANGTVVMNLDGSFTYTPDADFFGSDSFQFQATDPDSAASNAATISVEVAPLNDAPVAQVGSASGNEDTVISGAAVAADVDHAANLLTYALVGADGGAANGTVAMNPDGSFTYTPDADFFGSDSFQFQATDPDSATSNAATITVEVAAVNDAPVAQDGAVSGNVATVIAGVAVAADVDDAANLITYGLVGANGGAANGTVAMNPDGSFTYTPAANFAGSDAFQFQATDPDGAASNVATIAVTVEDSIAPDVVLLEDVLWQHDDGTVRTAGGTLGILPSTSVIGATGDFDGDGDADSDVVWHDSNQQVAVWEVQDGSLVQTHGLPTAPHTWHIEGSGDFDGDGDDDILWRHDDAQVVTWEMEDGDYVEHHHLPVDIHDDPTSASNSWQIDGTGDFDGDGDDDIVWRHDEGLVVTWEMEDGAYVVNHNLATVPTNWQIDGTGDFDGDGDDDIVWRHDEGQVVTWEMEDGAYVVNHDLATVPTNWQIAGTADFNDDGTSDILWRHDDGTVVTWEMENGNILQIQNFGVVDNSWQIRGTGEFPLI